MIVRIVIFTILFFFAFGTMEAQPGDPGGGTNPSIPFTGVEYLIALGGLLGLRFIKKMKSDK